MSYRNDRAHAPSQISDEPATGQTLHEVVEQALLTRRMVLRGGLSASIAAVFGGSVLAACSSDDTLVGLTPDASVDAPKPDTGTDANQSPNYAVEFKRIARSVEDTVTVPEGYSVAVMFVAGDALAAGSTPFSGSVLTSAQAEKLAGGNHDGMAFFELPGVDPNKGGLLAINHENISDEKIYFTDGKFPAAPTDEQKKLALAGVGVSVVEVELKDGKWSVKADSKYNKRYTGNTTYGVSGPAKAAVGDTVIGTLNNCSSGTTPWDTYLTCEETTNNYFDTTQAAHGYGWVVEIDPRGELGGLPVKRTALGRFSHENTAYLLASDNSMAFYMGDDSTPGCIYKFVPNGKYNPSNRAANATLLDEGTLYAARFNPDGTGEWRALVQGQNGLVVGAADPGDRKEGGGANPATVDFATQSDVVLNAEAASRVAGATVMDRPEWITIGPDKTIYCTLTNNSRRTADGLNPANPRQQNLHGHIIKWIETGNSPTATTFRWELFLQAGDPSLDNATKNLVGNINGDTFSSADGLRVDPKGRLWAQTDMSVPGDAGAPSSDGGKRTNVEVFGNNSMYYLDQVTKESRRFLVGPKGCEITGIAYTPDLTTFFINIQHPTAKWPSNAQGNDYPARSATIVVRRNDGKPIGA